METWARELASELSRRGIDVTLFKGAGSKDNRYEKVLRSCPVGERWNGRLHRALPSIAWRFGMGDPYSIAQSTFAFSLIAALGRSYDILHLQDTRVAELVLSAERLGLVKCQLLYAHGTGADPKSLEKMPFVQALTPYQYEIASSAGVDTRNWTVIPNFVDVLHFQPADQQWARRKWQLPPSAKILLSVGAIDHSMKRMDYLVRSFRRYQELSGDNDSLLVIAGHVDGRTENSAVCQLARELLGDRFRCLPNVDINDMASIYACADAFVLCSLVEPFGLVAIEAMASEVPCILADTSAMRWIGGVDGIYCRMTDPDDLGNCLRLHFAQEPSRLVARRQRQRCKEVFSKEVVVAQIVSHYIGLVSENY